MQQAYIQLVEGMTYLAACCNCRKTPPENPRWSLSFKAMLVCSSHAVMVETREMSPGREGDSHTVCVLANRSLGISLLVQKYNFCQSRCVIVGIFIDSTKGMGTNYKPN